MSDEVKVFLIGPDGTEYFAAHSAEEMREWYKLNCDTWEEDLREHFEELTAIDEEFGFDDDGEKSRTTWRKLALRSPELPCQIITGYN